MGLPTDLLREVESRFGSGADLALFTDLDGTLVGFMDRPDQVELTPRVRRLLERICQTPRSQLAVVSGRPLEQVRRMIALEGIICAGNHGLEIGGTGRDFTHPEADSCRIELKDIRDKVRARLSGLPGVWIEDKGLTATVHYRSAPECQNRVKRNVAEALEDGSRFRSVPGNMIEEIRPNVNWNKGKAVDWILKQIGLTRDAAIYLGDDVTDEDAFVELQAGITIRVGADEPTTARFRLPSVEIVEEFLEWLAALRRPVA